LQGNLWEKQRTGRKKARFIAENITLNQSLGINSAAPRNSGIKSAEQRKFSAAQGKSSGIACGEGNATGIGWS
jgi:hypothetical protein